MATQIVAFDQRKVWTLEVLTDDDSVTTVDIDQLAGPGVWRRVLEVLEAMGIEDRNHVLPAWEYGLIGEWHY